MYPTEIFVCGYIHYYYIEIHTADVYISAFRSIHFYLLTVLLKNSFIKKSNKLQLHYRLKVLYISGKIRLLIFVSLSDRII